MTMECDRRFWVPEQPDPGSRRAGGSRIRSYGARAVIIAASGGERWSPAVLSAGRGLPYRHGGEDVWRPGADGDSLASAGRPAHCEMSKLKSCRKVEQIRRSHLPVGCGASVPRRSRTRRRGSVLGSFRFVDGRKPPSRSPSERDESSLLPLGTGCYRDARNFQWIPANRVAPRLFGRTQWCLLETKYVSTVTKVK